jgi:hypothetical protein
METVCFSETLASTDESTRRRNPEERHHHEANDVILSSPVSSYCLSLRSRYSPYEPFLKHVQSETPSI